MMVRRVRQSRRRILKGAGHALPGQRGLAKGVLRLPSDRFSITESGEHKTTRHEHAETHQRVRGRLPSGLHGAEVRWTRAESHGLPDNPGGRLATQSRIKTTLARPGKPLFLGRQKNFLFF